MSRAIADQKTNRMSSLTRHQLDDSDQVLGSKKKTAKQTKTSDARDVGAVHSCP